MKKTMLRALSLILSVFMVLSVAGCGGEKAKTSEEPSNEPALTGLNANGKYDTVWDLFENNVDFRKDAEDAKAVLDESGSGVRVELEATDDTLIYTIYLAEGADADLDKDQKFRKYWDLLESDSITIAFQTLALYLDQLVEIEEPLITVEIRENDGTWIATNDYSPLVNKADLNEDMQITSMRAALDMGDTRDYLIADMENPVFAFEIDADESTLYYTFTYYEDQYYPDLTFEENQEIAAANMDGMALPFLAVLDSLADGSAIPDPKMSVTFRAPDGTELYSRVFTMDDVQKVENGEDIKEFVTDEELEAFKEEEKANGYETLEDYLNSTEFKTQLYESNAESEALMSTSFEAQGNEGTMYIIYNDENDELYDWDEMAVSLQQILDDDEYDYQSSVDALLEMTKADSISLKVVYGRSRYSELASRTFYSSR